MLGLRGISITANRATIAILSFSLAGPSAEPLEEPVLTARRNRGLLLNFFNLAHLAFDTFVVFHFMLRKRW